jgi:hypothetical protein
MREEQPAIRAHEHAKRNRKEIRASGVCGCFHCISMFPPSHVKRWLQQTAFCPHCNVDAVIGGASGFPITADFLTEMQRVWFNRGWKKVDNHWEISDVIDDRAVHVANFWPETKEVEFVAKLPVNGAYSILDSIAHFHTPRQRIDPLKSQ